MQYFTGGYFIAILDIEDCSFLLIIVPCMVLGTQLKPGAFYTLTSCRATAKQGRQAARATADTSTNKIIIAIGCNGCQQK